jgi:hypothetical protein
LWLDDHPESPENTRIRRSIPGHQESKPLPGLGKGRMSLVADNKGISLEDQVDVTLFTSVDAIVEFLSLPKQKKFAKYPPSLFRIVTNRRLFVGPVDGPNPDGFCARMRSIDTWQSAFPAIMVFHGSCNNGLDALQGRPNMKVTQNAKDCEFFVSFESAGVAALKAIDGTAAASSQVLRTAHNAHTLCNPPANNLELPH